MRFPEFENNIPNMSSAEYAQFLTRVIQMVNAGSLTPKTATDFINSYNDPAVREHKDRISHIHKDVFKNIAQRLDPADLISLRVASKTIHNRFIQQYMIDRLPLFEKAIAEIFDVIKLMNSRAFKYIISCQIALSPSVHLKFNSYTPQLYIEEVKVTLKNLKNRTENTHISVIDRVKINTNVKPIQNRRERAKRIASILNQNLSFNDVAKLKTKALLKTEVLIYTDGGESKLFESFGSSLTPVVFPAEVKAIENVPFKNAIQHLEAILKTFSEAFKGAHSNAAGDSVVFDIEEFRLFDDGEAPASASASPQ